MILSAAFVIPKVVFFRSSEISRRSGIDIFAEP
jgi:hypothetical protein